MEIQNINIELISPNEDQPRNEINAKNPKLLKELKDSIIGHGLLQPIIVKKVSDEQYSILAGHRRYYACQEIGWTEVPCYVLEGDTDERIIALTENLLRKDLDKLEKAMAIKKLRTAYASNRDLARHLGVSEGFIRKMLALLEPKEEAKTINLIKHAQKIQKEIKEYVSDGMDEGKIVYLSEKIKELDNYISNIDTLVTLGDKMIDLRTGEIAI